MGFKGLCGDGGRRGWEGEYGGKSRDANFFFKLQRLECLITHRNSFV